MLKKTISETFIFRVAKEDEGASIECVFVPVYGERIQVEETINVGCE